MHIMRCSFRDALRAVNTHLAEVYRFLTGGEGDAYLRFTEDPRLLFTNGVELHVRCLFDGCVLLMRQ